MREALDDYHDPSLGGDDVAHEFAERPFVGRGLAFDVGCVVTTEGIEQARLAVGDDAGERIRRLGGLVADVGNDARGDVVADHGAIVGMR